MNNESGKKPSGNVKDPNSKSIQDKRGRCRAVLVNKIEELKAKTSDEALIIFKSSATGKFSWYSTGNRNKMLLDFHGSKTKKEIIPKPSDKKLEKSINRNLKRKKMSGTCTIGNAAATSTESDKNCATTSGSKSTQETLVVKPKFRKILPKPAENVPETGAEVDIGVARNSQIGIRVRVVKNRLKISD